MPLPTIPEQKPDVYDVISGGDDAFDPRTTPIFNMLPNGPDSPEAKKFQFVFDSPDDPSAEGSAEGGEWSQGALDSFGDPTRLYGRMHHQKLLIGAGEVTEGDQGYAMQGLSRFQYDLRRAMRKLIVSAELICIGAQENQAGSTAVAYKTRGLELYILPTSLIALQTDEDTVIPADYRPAAGQIKEVTTGTGDYDFAESDLKTMLQTGFETRKAKIQWDLWCTPRLQGKISDWGNLQPTVNGYANIRRFNQNAGEMKMITTFRKFVGDCGDVETDLHPFLRLNTGTQKAEGLALFKGMQMKRVRRKPMVSNMPDDAGVKRAFGMMTWGVQCIPKYNGQVRRAAA